MFRTLAPALTLLALLLPALPAAADDGNDRHEHERHHERHHGEGEHSPFAHLPLIMLMHNMQYYAHKLGLAVDAGNADLTRFYSRELEEVIEAVGEIREYEGIPIAKHLGVTLKPAYAKLEQAIDRGDTSAINGAYHNLLAGCNACHQSSQRPFIVIRHNRVNPYMQDFSPHN